MFLVATRIFIKEESGRYVKLEWKALKYEVTILKYLRSIARALLHLSRGKISRLIIVSIGRFISRDISLQVARDGVFILRIQTDVLFLS